MFLFQCARGRGIVHCRSIEGSIFSGKYSAETSRRSDGGKYGHFSFTSTAADAISLETMAAIQAYQSICMTLDFCTSLRNLFCIRLSDHICTVVCLEKYAREIESNYKTDVLELGQGSGDAKISAEDDEDGFFLPVAVVCGSVLAVLVVVFGIYVVRTRAAARAKLDGMQDFEAQPSKAYEVRCGFFCVLEISISNAASSSVYTLMGFTFQCSTRQSFVFHSWSPSRRPSPAPWI